MKTESTQQNSSSSGGVSTTQPVRTSSTRSSVQRHDGLPSHTLDHATESMEEEGGYEGEDGDDDDDEGMTIEQGSTGEHGQEILSETTVKSGYLYKRGEKRKNWKKRWFVLRSAKLYYYKNEKEYQLLRFIDMTEVHTIAAVELKKVEHCFGISTSKRQYYVRATSAKEMQSWVDGLRDVREQVRQRSTLTRDMALLDVGNVSSGGENQITAHALATPKNASQAASPKPVDQLSSPTGKQGTGSQPISIMIPGKGIYTAPAQARITSGNTVLSPLTATSDSETGGPSGAEQFGLSYASSAGQSMASSPGRSGIFHHGSSILHQQHQAQHTDYSSGGGHSPQSHSGGDEAAEMIRGKRGVQRGSGFREASVGSSTGEAAASGLTRTRSDSQQAGHPLSSSEDEGEGEGDDWDEEEEADLAMPLPNTGGLSLMSSFSHGHGTQASSKQGQTLPSEPSSSVITTVPKPKVGPEFFKDSSKVIHQGYLMKQSNRRKHWRKRWFVLTSGSLSYTRSHMDAKLHRQIPLSSILDAIEYTSKKTNQHSAPLSPTLGAFGGSNPLASFGRSPLLGGGGDFNNAPERRGSTQSRGTSASHTSNAGLVPSSDHEHGAISANEAESGNERRGSAVNAASIDSKQPATPAKKKKDNCFKIITPKRVYIVCAPTEEEELKWLSALQALLAHYHEKDKNAAAAAAAATSTTSSAHANEVSQERQEQSVTSPIQPGSPTQTPVASNRFSAPSISLSKPVRQGSQDDTRATAQEGVKAT